MIDLSKSYEFFEPEKCTERIHIIGCGSVGFTVAELLARFGLTKFSLYDFDCVVPHNLANQMFVAKDIGKLKVDAVMEHLCEINADIANDIRLYPDGWDGQSLTGYVFLCVDNIELRKRICTENKFNNNIKAVFDFRTRLVDGQHFAADWHKMDQKEYLISTMNFSHEEAMEATPVSACKVPLGVAPTVRLVSNVGVVNFINFAKEKKLKQNVIVNAFDFITEAF